MLKQVKGIQFPSADRVRYITRHVIGLIIGIVGLADMLSAIVPKLNWDILLGAWPIIVHGAQAQTLTVVIGFFLIMLSYGLARGKRHAWRITLLLSVLSAFLLPILHACTIPVAVVALLLVLLLGIFSPFFQAKSDPPSALRGYVALMLG